MGSGLGGRSQELALAAAPYAGRATGYPPCSALAATAPTAPPTRLAAMWTVARWGRLRGALMDPDLFLMNNDSYHALRACDGLLVTGPTRHQCERSGRRDDPPVNPSGIHVPTRGANNGVFGRANTRHGYPHPQKSRSTDTRIRRTAGRRYVVLSHCRGLRSAGVCVRPLPGALLHRLAHPNGSAAYPAHR